MTEERKREIADEIIAAFKSTGVRPETGDYLRHDRELGYSACAVGVIAYTSGIRNQDEFEPIEKVFAERVGVDEETMTGVIHGFDDKVPRKDFRNDKFRNGYDIGRMVREAVLP